MWRIRRDPSSITNSTHRVRKLAVTTVKRSHATITSAWFLTNVVQR
jgi:hypothetical protein